MKTGEEMAKSALQRVKAYENEQKKRKRAALKFLPLAVSVCLLLCLGWGLWQTGVLSERTEPPAAGGDPAADGTRGTAEASGKAVSEHDGEGKNETETATEGEVGSNGHYTSGEDASLIFWESRFSMYPDLYEAITKDPGGEFPVFAAYRPATANITSFSYEGKTLSEWVAATERETQMTETLFYLKKTGDALKYGEALYLSGTPSGEKWSRELYEKTVSGIGEEVLGTYIVNGDFLCDALDRDLAELLEGKAEKGYQRAVRAYMDSVLLPVMRRLSDMGVLCERASDASNALVFRATAETLRNLPFSDPENWVLAFASDALFDGPRDQTADEDSLFW